jgi:hypothetical protein
MHVTAVLDAIKKRGHFNDYNVAYKAHKEAAKAAESAEVGLGLPERTSEKLSKHKLKKLAKAAKLAKAKEAAKAAELAMAKEATKEVSEKAKEATNEAPAKAQETEPVPQEAVAPAVAPEDSMRAGFQSDLEKAQQAQETAKGTTAAASLMFAFYQICFLPRASTRGTRSSMSRRNATHM